MVRLVLLCLVVWGFLVFTLIVVVLVDQYRSQMIVVKTIQRRPAVVTKSIEETLF